MSMQHLSRIGSARRNVRIARYAIGLTAAAGLAVFAAAARASHPGSHHSVRAGSAAASRSSQSESSTENFFGYDGSSSIGPSGSAGSQLQSGGS
jgi:hypothetical protein